MGENGANWIFLTILLFLNPKDISCSQDQQLRAEYLPTKLPTRSYAHKAHFDGDDAIYLFGGVHEDHNDKQILRFNIVSETVEKVGQFSTGMGYSAGSVQMDPLGNMFYMGGYFGQNIMKYEPAPSSNQTIVAATTPYGLYWSDSVKLNHTSNIVYIFGGTGNPNGILKFDMHTYDLQSIGSFPSGDSYVACERVDGAAFLIGNSGSFLQIDLESLDIVYESLIVLPLMSLYGETVETGKHVYITGGYKATVDFPIDGIIQLDPETLVPSFIQVSDFPIQGTDTYFYYSPSAVFVEKLNRIYFFGGSVQNKDTSYPIPRDDIWFIDLDPLEPPTTTTTTTTSNPEPTSPSTTTISPDIFTCVNRTDGTYPHPHDCTMFIGCLDGEMETYSCPPPLLFNPLNRRGCEWPDDVDCDLHCVDREDGNYPHPHDCSLFIVCHGGLLHVFKCPQPLLFDIDLRECYFPHVANCKI